MVQHRGFPKQVVIWDVSDFGGLINPFRKHRHRGDAQHGQAFQSPVSSREASCILAGVPKRETASMSIKAALLPHKSHHTDLLSPPPQPSYA